ncbi:hypothetical protein [Vagococcus zengguangii]|nr:hypothetical protein [Vagococcus zengguangii]
MRVINAKDVANIKLLEEALKMEIPSLELKQGRQRPRNPDEKEVLLRWERKRGTKIGTI